jgi:hypothetical protein
MRLPGFCTECRRVKQVRVSNAGMASLAKKGVAFGICSSCEDKESKR